MAHAVTLVLSLGTGEGLMASRCVFKGICLSLVSLLFVLVFTFNPEQSDALTCVWPGSPLETLEDSDAVFKGKAVSKRYHQSGKSTGNIGATSMFQVETVWKGQVSQTAFVVPGVDFEEGESYLIYASGDLGDGTFTFGLCSRTRLIYNSWEEDIVELGEGYAPNPDEFSPVPFPTPEQVPTKAWSNPAPDAPIPTPEQVPTKAWSNPAPDAPIPTPEQVPTKAWSNPAPDAPSEEGGGGCGLSRGTIDVSYVGLLVGLAWFALQRRRSDPM